MSVSEEINPPEICDLTDDGNIAGFVAMCLDDMKERAEAAWAEHDGRPWVHNPRTAMAYTGDNFVPLLAGRMPATAEYVSAWSPNGVLEMITVDRMVLLQHLLGPEGHTCPTCGPAAGAWPCQPLRILAARWAAIGGHLIYREGWDPPPTTTDWKQTYDAYLARRLPPLVVRPDDCASSPSP